MSGGRHDGSLADTNVLQKVLKFYKLYGYLADIPCCELCRVDRHSASLILATKKFQDFYLPDIVGVVDGSIGPKVLAAMDLPRCGHPDLHDDPEVQEGVHARVDHEDVVGAGRGSWPTSCHETGIKVHIDTGRKPSFLDHEEIYQVSAREYAKVGCKLIRHPTSGGANIRQSWRVLRGSTIGLAEFNNQRCSDSVFNYRDPGYRGDLALQINLDMHELGHNMNLQHTRGGIMNPSIIRTPNRWVEFDSNGRVVAQDVSYRTLTRFFGGKPVDDPDPPPPPDPDPDGDLSDIIIDLIRGCLNRGDSSETIRRRIRNPEAIDKARLSVAIRLKFDLSPEEWRAQGPAYMRRIDQLRDAATGTDIERIVQAAQIDP